MPADSLELYIADLKEILLYPYSVGTPVLSRGNSDRFLGVVVEITKTSVSIDWINADIFTYAADTLSHEEFIFVSPENYEDLYDLL